MFQVMVFLLLHQRIHDYSIVLRSTFIEVLSLVFLFFRFPIDNLLMLDDFSPLPQNQESTHIFLSLGSGSLTSARCGPSRPSGIRPAGISQPHPEKMCEIVTGTKIKWQS